MKKILALCLCALFCVLPLTACKKSDVTVPYGLQLASDPNVADYYLFVPDDWTVDISTGVTYAYHSANDPSSISATVYKLGKDVVDADGYWDYYKAQFAGVFGDPENVETATTLLGGKEATQYVYTAELGNSGYKFWQVVCVNRGQVYILTYASTAENYDKHTDDMQAVVESFLFM